MGIRQYIGARYVPKFYDNPNGTSEWLSNVIYEPLTIVTYGSNSYTSKKSVPASVGDPANNPEYWVATGNLNAFITELQTQIDNMNDGDIEGSLQNQINDIKDGDVTGSLQNQINDMKDGDVTGSLQNQINNMNDGDVEGSLQNQIDNIIDNIPDKLKGKRVALYGDSWSSSDLPYHTWINAIDEATGLPTHVSAAGGYTFEQFYSDLWDDYPADIYVIVGGINDTLYKHSLTSDVSALSNLIDAMRTVSPNCEIFITTPPKQLNPTNAALALYSIPFEMVRQMIWHVAIEKHIKVISGLNCTNFLINPETDGCHPVTTQSNLALLGKWVVDGIYRDGDSRDYFFELVWTTIDGARASISQHGSDTLIYYGGNATFSSGSSSTPVFPANYATLKTYQNGVGYYGINAVYSADMMYWCEEISNVITFVRKLTGTNSSYSGAANCPTRYVLTLNECS